MYRPAALLVTSILACAPPASTTGTGDGSSGGSTSTSTGEPTSGGASATSSTSATTSTSSSTSATDSTSSSSTGEASTDATTGEPVVGPRYDEVRQKSAHNSFQRDEALFDMLVYHRIRSLEFDVHVGKSFEPDVPGDWYVYHVDVVDSDSQCRTLSQCLAQVAALQRVVPEHEVVTLWIDLKDGFDGEHSPADLDALLAEAFGARLWTPGELLAGCPGAGSLQEAIANCGWPELVALRGRVVVALTGGGLDDPNGALAGYVGGDAGARATFVAPDLADAAAIAAHGEAIFHNLAVDDVALAEQVRAAGQVSRVWVLDDADAWAGAVEAGAHHLASNKINAAVDPWATTAGAGGWPFSCLDACEAPASEPGAIVAVDVDSGDLWDEGDEAVFAHLPAAAGDLTITAAIAVPSSHVEPWGKACVGARGGLEAGAPYLAICRATDDHPLRVQVRETADAATEAFEMADVDGLSTELPAYVRLVREGACVRGLGSADAVTWSPVAEHCFAAAPMYVGLLASSHGAGQLRMLFVDLQASPGGSVGAGDLSVVALGAGAGDIQDGLGP